VAIVNQRAFDGALKVLQEDEALRQEDISWECVGEQVRDEVHTLTEPELHTIAHQTNPPKLKLGIRASMRGCHKQLTRATALFLWRYCQIRSENGRDSSPPATS